MYFRHIIVNSSETNISNISYKSFKTFYQDLPFAMTRCLQDIVVFILNWCVYRHMSRSHLVVSVLGLDLTILFRDFDITITDTPLQNGLLYLILCNELKELTMFYLLSRVFSDLVSRKFSRIMARRCEWWVCDSYHYNFVYHRNAKLLQVTLASYWQG